MWLDDIFLMTAGIIIKTIPSNKNIIPKAENKLNSLVILAIYPEPHILLSDVAMIFERGSFIINYFFKLLEV